MSMKRVGFAVSLFVAAQGIATADTVTPNTPVSCVVGAVGDYLAASFVDANAEATPVDPRSADEIALDNAVENIVEVEGSLGDADAPTSSDPRGALTNFAMQLLDIRYRRGGQTPSTGFDCSGFVHYVFAQVFGVDLPQNSAQQYQVGKQVARSDMQVGDLVFFKVHGKRISHVGIYLGDGRFIHSPTTGERVRVSNLAENYWARRFAGARRPSTLI